MSYILDLWVHLYRNKLSKNYLNSRIVVRFIYWDTTFLFFTSHNQIVTILWFFCYIKTAACYVIIIMLDQKKIKIHYIALHWSKMKQKRIRFLHHKVRFWLFLEEKKKNRRNYFYLIVNLTIINQNTLCAHFHTSYD